MSPLLCIFYKLPCTRSRLPHRHVDFPTDTRRPPSASSAHVAVQYLQRGLQRIHCPQFLRDPAALAREAARCRDGWLHLSVSPWKSLPFHCQLVLFLKSCSGISLISHAVVGIKKAAGKLGNRFLGVKDKKGKHGNSKENTYLIPDPICGKLDLFLSITLLYIRICFTEDKTATLKQIYKYLSFTIISLDMVFLSTWGWKLWEQGQD